MAGSAVYTDDEGFPSNGLHGAFAYSSKTNVIVESIKNIDEIKSFPGVVKIIQETDIPGKNNIQVYMYVHVISITLTHTYVKG